MFSLAIKWQMVSSNRAKGIERNGEVKRARYMIGDELAKLTKALAEHPSKSTADIIRMLLLTGARRGEVLSMRWDDVDLKAGVWSKPASSTKQKANHIVPLSAPARQLLSEIAVQQKYYLKVDIPASARLSMFSPATAMPVTSLKSSGHGDEFARRQASRACVSTICVIRFASQLASGGASLPLIGALLGHSSPMTTSSLLRICSMIHNALRSSVSVP